VLPVVGLAALAGCQDVPLAPKWNADFFLPIQFADVILGGPNGVAPGGIIPPANVTNTSTIGTQDVSGATKQVLDEDVNSINADVVFATTADLTGTIQISVSPNQADLFSADPTKALTTTITIRKTDGDTSHVSANVNVFRSSSQNSGAGNNTGNSGSGSNTGNSGGNANNVLYSQSKTTVACRSGLCPVSATDKLQLGVNLVVNVAVSK
jgi:hypothetical protein